MKEKVSVIITTYKRKFEILERAINSVLLQTYSNIEIIVVNDNSKDDSFFIDIEENIKKFGNRIIYISYPENQGACVARNKGALRAEGKYIAFLDDDDQFKKNKIEKQVEVLEKYSANFVTCLYEPLGNSSKKRRIRRNMVTTIDKRELWQRNCVGGCSEPLMSKELFIKAGMFMEKLPQSQDYDLWIRIAKLCTIYKINEALVKYSTEDNNSISKNYRKIINASKTLLKKYENEEDGKEFLKRMYYVIAYSYLCIGEREEANKYYKKGKQIKKYNIYLLRYRIRIMMKGRMKYQKSN